MKYLAPQPPREQVSKELQSYLGEVYREFQNLYLEVQRLKELVVILQGKTK
jgi:hypothetical protein